MKKNSFGAYDYINYDICICGNDIIPVVLGVEKYSNININEIKLQIEDKIEWYRKEYNEDYIRMFGSKKIDIFKMVSKRINKGWFQIT